MAELKERYAGALFELYVEKGKPEEYHQQAVFVRNVLKDPEWDDFLRHPHVPAKEKQELFQRLFGGKISSELMGFLSLAVDKRREELIVPALDTFIDRVDQLKGKVAAIATFAFPPSEKQLATLKDLLERKLSKQVAVTAKVDPLLVGGFYIHIDGRLIDCTVRTQLKKMKESMIRGIPNDRKTR